MANYFAMTAIPLPAQLFGEDTGHSIRLITDEERIATEDFFFSLGERVRIDASTTVVVVSDSRLAHSTLEEFAVLVEFALLLISSTGFPSVTMVASLSSDRCLSALQRPRIPCDAPRFLNRLTGNAACTWVRQFFIARGNTKDRLHVTADRFVRFCIAGSTADGLLDLCISLESLIESETEISFRFAVCLAKVTGEPDAEELSVMLTDLYSLRSKVVHGSDTSKAHKKLAPNIPRLRGTARTILTRYIFHLAENTKDDWKRRLKSSLFA
jgi:hypothetical protein